MKKEVRRKALHILIVAIALIEGIIFAITGMFFMEHLQTVLMIVAPITGGMIAWVILSNRKHLQ